MWCHVIGHCFLRATSMREEVWQPWRKCVWFLSEFFGRMKGCGNGASPIVNAEVSLVGWGVLGGCELGACEVHTISVLYWAHLWMKCSFGISDFLEEISSLFHSVVFSISLHWLLKKAFLSLLAILWTLHSNGYIWMGIFESFRWEAFHFPSFHRHPVPSLHGKWMGKLWKQWLTLFFWAPKSLQMVTAAMKLKDAYSLKGKLWPT